MILRSRSLDAIKEEISLHRDFFDRVHKVRQAVRGYNNVALDERGESGSRVRAMLAAAPGRRTFNLLAQGDSWFDYPIGTDIIDCLHANHGHSITNIAVAGSTLNDEAYGPVPSEMFGLPMGFKQSDDPSRIAELVRRIQQDKPQALLLSAGGNDIAGDEFFNFINNAESGLTSVNQEVLDGVINSTFSNAYTFLINMSIAAAADAGLRNMVIFTHGYDYPWPDGRGVIAFLGWRIGPWFDASLNQKNYPNNNARDLRVRHDIVAKFIDSLNTMLAGLVKNYPGKVFHVDLTNTLKSEHDWANELHPSNSGFSALANKIDAALQAFVPSEP